VVLGLVKGEHITASCSPKDVHCAEAFKVSRKTGPQRAQVIFKTFCRDFQTFGSTITFDNRVVADKSDVLLLAVKPNFVKIVLDEVRPNFTPKHLLLSVAMGVTVSQLEQVWHNTINFPKIPKHFSQRCPF